MMFESIVLALDGSELSDRAVPVAAELAKQSGGRIVVAHVDERTVVKGDMPPVHPDEAELIERVKGQAEKLSAGGIESTVELRSSVLGGAAPAIAGIASEVDAGVIVVGSRGQSALAGIVLGSVAHKLLHIAGRPVLVVPSS
jgi:nucleotide-binding universal stress UspA family protein